MIPVLDEGKSLTTLVAAISMHRIRSFSISRTLVYLIASNNIIHNTEIVLCKVINKQTVHTESLNICSYICVAYLAVVFEAWVIGVSLALSFHNIQCSFLSSQCVIVVDFAMSGFTLHNKQQTKQNKTK